MSNSNESVEFVSKSTRFNLGLGSDIKAMSSCDIHDNIRDNMAMFMYISRTARRMRRVPLTQLNPVTSMLEACTFPIGEHIK